MTASNCRPRTASASAVVAVAARVQPGELLDRVRPELRVVAYEDGFLDSPPRFVQRIAAVRQTIADTSANPERWPLPDS